MYFTYRSQRKFKTKKTSRMACRGFTSLSLFLLYFLVDKPYRMYGKKISLTNVCISLPLSRASILILKRKYRAFDHTKPLHYFHFCTYKTIVHNLHSFIALRTLL